VGFVQIEHCKIGPLANLERADPALPAHRPGAVDRRHLESLFAGDDGWIQGAGFVQI